ncbi:3-methyladenine DNA glycosylase [Corynebacterium endometrii]|uniref:3-methyladenine DNA glycosylase n=1 Tax=Corynebacterium endometrii TaxID=2488819 RepID=A0A4P7QFU3_9CORY|nr:3-methyladenine DNA glycosylase [Corynebacterium endometrii]QCB28409.1 hypothetical protein CENDO_05645 [Corynebacterium endometrii]
MRVATQQEWQARLDDHVAQATQLTEGHLARRSKQQRHPVEDFLFDYYPVRPSQLKKWHPGAGVVLQGSPPHARWRDYTSDSLGTWLDVEALWERRGQSIEFIREFLSRTADNPAHFDCFGLHEWAMVYRTNKPRHNLPLRLGVEGTNAVVENHKIKCTHYDAYRFFTEPARPLNLTVLDREGQIDKDQCGCVHVTMDLYKWASKLGPLVPGDLFLATFRLALEARTLDMEASPYDCRGLGYGVVAIETPAGKAEYVDRQRRLAEKAKPLRDRLVAAIDAGSAIRMGT